MKAKLLLATICMSFSAMAMADILYKVEAHQETLLRKTEKNRFEKISQSTTGKETTIIRLRGQVIGQTERELSAPEDKSFYALTATGKKTVRIEDERDQINAEVEATMNFSLFGNMKTLNISGKTMDSVYADSYRKVGLDLLKNSNVGGLLKSEIHTSDLSCIRDGELLKCSQDQVLNFRLGN